MKIGVNLFSACLFSVVVLVLNCDISWLVRTLMYVSKGIYDVKVFLVVF